MVLVASGCCDNISDRWLTMIMMVLIVMTEVVNDGD